jgi:hypothetical protein
MGFTDDFTACITGKTLPPELANLMPDPKTALVFAAKLIRGATVAEALIFIGVGAQLAAEVAEAVSAFTVGAIIGAVLGCAGSAVGGNLSGAVAQLDPSDQSALADPLSDAGFPTSAAA